MLKSLSPISIKKDAGQVAKVESYVKGLMKEPVNNYPPQFPMPPDRFLKRLDLHAMENRLKIRIELDGGRFETSFIIILAAYLPVLLGINRKEYKNETS